MSSLVSRAANSSPPNSTPFLSSSSSSSCYLDENSAGRGMNNDPLLSMAAAAFSYSCFSPIALHQAEYPLNFPSASINDGYNIHNTIFSSPARFRDHLVYCMHFIGSSIWNLESCLSSCFLRYMRLSHD